MGDFIDNWLDKIFNRAIESRIKNDPVIKKIKNDADNAVKKAKDEIIKRYGSLENTPKFYQTLFKDD